MPRKKAFDREVVLEKALLLFWEKGFNATSMQDLVEALGINRASMYDTFGSKEALFEEAFKLYQCQNQHIIQNILATHKNIKEGLRYLFEKGILESIRAGDRKGCFVVNTTTELLPCEGRWLALIAENQRLMEELFDSYLKTGVERGELPAAFDTKAYSEYLFTLYNGLQVVAKINPDPDKIRRTIGLGINSMG